MKRNELIFAAMLCVTVILIIRLLSGCIATREREHTEQLRVLSTNEIRHMDFP